MLYHLYHFIQFSTINRKCTNVKQLFFPSIFIRIKEMCFKNLFLFLFFSLICVYCCQSKVVMIQAIIRHANRNPYQGPLQSWYYPKDPYQDEDYFPEGVMELTQMGKINAYNYGKILRKQYQTLIGSTYNPRHIYIEAIKRSRTITTAQLIAAGLFPPLEKDVWNTNLAWVPVPIHVVSENNENSKLPMTFCENYNIDRRRANIQIREVFKVLSDVQDLFKYLSVHTGANYTYPTQAWLLYHQLATRANLSLELEPWASLVFPNGKLVDISAVEYVLQTYTSRMKRLLGGIWIKTFLNWVDKLIVNKTNSQIRGSFYVCSEQQIAAVLNTLGVYKPHVPGYLSSIIFELHKINKNYYVKVIYRNEDVIEEYEIPGCQNSLCLLSTFRAVVDDVTTKDFNTDCGKRGNYQTVDILNYV